MRRRSISNVNWHPPLRPVRPLSIPPILGDFGQVNRFADICCVVSFDCEGAMPYLRPAPSIRPPQVRHLGTQMSTLLSVLLPFGSSFPRARCYRSSEDERVPSSVTT